MPTSSPTELFPKLLAYIQDNVVVPPAERREPLDHMSDFISRKGEAGEIAHLVFICTHNSRRSHLAALWTQAASAYYGVLSVRCYSGGTEATAFYPSAVAALRDAGFQIAAPPSQPQTNPRYRVRVGPDIPVVEAFSKKFTDSANPVSDFAAIMTCSEADAACPIVPGACARIPLPFDDPKQSDGSPEESARYLERSRQICQEMLYAIRRAAQVSD